MRTQQELVNTVATHLRTQGHQSRDLTREVGTICLYHGPNDTCCSIGHLIPDDRYRPDFEGGGLATIWSQIQDLFPPGAFRLLSELQQLHDDQDHWDHSGFNTVGENYLKIICHIHELTYPEVN